jgi:hypothetical protein
VNDWGFQIIPCRVPRAAEVLRQGSSPVRLADLPDFSVADRNHWFDGAIQQQVHVRLEVRLAIGRVQTG